MGPFLVISPWLLSRAGQHNGQTWGKSISRIRAIRDDGREWTFWTACWRQIILKFLVPAVIITILLVLASGFHNLHIEPVAIGFALVGILSIVGFTFWPLTNRKRQAFHDKLACSYVKLLPKTTTNTKPGASKQQHKSFININQNAVREFIVRKTKKK